jgi:hypothetical protein
MRLDGILAMTFSAGLLTVTALAHNQSSPKQANPNIAVKTQDEETLKQSRK